MSTLKQVSDLEWLQENCEGDDELVELIGSLARDGRTDLLRLVRDFRSPPLRSDEEIIARVGSAEAVERQLTVVHAYLGAILKRRYEAADKDGVARRYYQGLGRRKDNLKGMIHDPAWAIAGTVRRALLDIYHCARPEAGDDPVAYAQLPGRLFPGTAEELRELILLLRERHNSLRKRKDKGGKD